MNAQNILDFWFKELTQEQWFAPNTELDQKIRSRFGDLLESAKRGELFPWRESAQGRLAEIILLDQFSRNVYRGTPNAFAADTHALILSQEMVLLKLDQKLSLNERSFCYMPYMHSESRLIHEEAMKLFAFPGLEFNLKFEIAHKDIIDRFGRYPHRNQILGRESTPEELEFLKTHSGF